MGAIALQWGRDRVIAEMVLAKAYQKEAKELQWGRDRVIAEMWRRRSGRKYCYRFNGAAIV